YVNGMVGSIYKQQAPLADAYTKAGQWQVYDIFWKAPVFGTDGKLESPAIITVMLNGVLIQNNYVLKGTTEYIGFPKYNAHGRLPLMLQNHGDAVAYRNIWIRNL
ncbi:3-keto-disaccharide hydrolase, partial [Dysgonomonas gadei]